MDDYKVVTCKFCRKPEYWELMHWKDGQEMCRKCVYEVWIKESKRKWSPGKNDYTYPLYSDGKDHSKGASE